MKSTQTFHLSFVAHFVRLLPNELRMRVRILNIYIYVLNALTADEMRESGLSNTKAMKLVKFLWFYDCKRKWHCKHIVGCVEVKNVFRISSLYCTLNEVYEKYFIRCING